MLVINESTAAMLMISTASVTDTNKPLKTYSHNNIILVQFYDEAYSNVKLFCWLTCIVKLG